MAKKSVTRKPKALDKNSRATVSGPADPAATQATNDDLTAKMAATQDLAAADSVQPQQAAGVRSRRGRRAARRRTFAPHDPIVGASTVTEKNGSEKVGSGSPTIGDNKTIGPLDRVRVDSTEPALTTNQGVPVGDNQNSLKAGLRGPTLLEDFILREKITHFDHERIPERIVHARGSAAHGYFECYESLERVHARLALLRGRQADAGVRPLLDRDRRARIDRHRPRRARLRGEVLHRRRQLGSGRQQHPGLLHPGRDEVSRPGPRGEARAALRDAAGGHRARHLLGLRVADARDHRTC